MTNLSILFNEKLNAPCSTIHNVGDKVYEGKLDEKAYR